LVGTLANEFNPTRLIVAVEGADAAGPFALGDRASTRECDSSTQSLGQQRRDL
jgi:hypothetical protein